MLRGELLHARAGGAIALHLFTGMVASPDNPRRSDQGVCVTWVTDLGAGSSYRHIHVPDRIPARYARWRTVDSVIRRNEPVP